MKPGARETTTNWPNALPARLRPLAASGYVPKQQLDQAEVAERDTATALVQAQERHAAAVEAIDTEAAAEATVLLGERPSP